MDKLENLILDDHWKYQNYAEPFDYGLPGSERIHRVFCKEKCKIKIALPNVLDADQLYVYSNVYGAWSFKKLKHEEQNSFSFDTSSPGVFDYTLAVLDTNLKICRWLPLPHKVLFVDPASCHNIRFYTFVPNVSGDYKQWFDDFLAIKSMGFDYIHLLPIVKMDVTESPYACSDFFEVDPAFRSGNSTQTVLDEIIAFCKENQIHLCVDLVFNHVGVHHKICKENPHWIKSDKQFPDGLKRAGCWHGSTWLVWDDIVLINYDHPNDATRTNIFHYMKEYALFWSALASATQGMIRYDNLHSSNFAFIQFVTKSIKQEFPNLIVLSELFCGADIRDKYRVDSHSNLLFATPWMNPYAVELRKQILQLHEQFDSVNYLFPISSHDSPSAFEMYGSHQAAVTRYAVQVFFGLGASGLSQGLEYRAEKKVPFIGLSDRIEKTIDPVIADNLLRINDLGKNYKSFGVKNNFKFIDHNHSAILAGIRIGFSVNEPDFLIIANLNSSHAEYLSIEEEFVQHFEAINILTDEKIDLKNLVEIMPGRCFILKSK